MADEIRATPQNRIGGLLSGGLSYLNQGISQPFGYQNPPGAMLVDLLGLPALQRTIERMSYGEPLTTGSGMTTRPRQDTLDAALAVAPFVKPTQAVGRVALEEALAANASRRAFDPTGQRGVIGIRFKTGIPTEVPGFGPAKEIPDTYSSIKPEMLKEMSSIFGQPITLKDILEHPSLYRDYPELAKYPVKGLGLFQPDLKGAYGEGKLYLQRKFNPSPEDIKQSHSTLLHEIQHAIQELDKMPMGGMTEDFLSKAYEKAAGKISTIKNESNKQLQIALEQRGLPSSVYADIIFNNKKGLEAVSKFPELNELIDYNRKARKAEWRLQDKYQEAYEKYKSYAGETQARAVQKRFENPQEYRKDVLESYDRPVESLIYRDPFGNPLR